MSSKFGKRTPAAKPLSIIPAPKENRYVKISKKDAREKTPQCCYRSKALIPGDIHRDGLYLLGCMLEEILYEELREKRAWVYSVRVDTFDDRLFQTFTIDCSFKSAAIKKIETVVEDSIAQLSEREDMFDRLKNHDIAEMGLSDRRAEDVLDTACCSLVDFQRIITAGEKLEYLRSVTMADVRRAIGWIAPDRRWTLLSTV